MFGYKISYETQQKNFCPCFFRHLDRQTYHQGANQRRTNLLVFLLWSGIKEKLVKEFFAKLEDVRQGI